MLSRFYAFFAFWKCHCSVTLADPDRVTARSHGSNVVLRSHSREVQCLVLSHVTGGARTRVELHIAQLQKPWRYAYHSVPFCAHPASRELRRGLFSGIIMSFAKTQRASY